MAGRKSLYTPERVKTILDTIRQTGLDKAGFEAGGINHDTFYVWLKEKPEFAEAVTRAKQEFKSILPEKIIEKANQALLEYLDDKKVECWKTSKKVKVYRFKYDKEKKETIRYLFEEIEEEDEKFVNRPCPVSILDRVLPLKPKSIALLDAVKILAQEGFLSESQGRVMVEAIAKMEDHLKQLNGKH